MECFYLHSTVLLLLVCYLGHPGQKATEGRKEISTVKVKWKHSECCWLFEARDGPATIVAPLMPFSSSLLLWI